MRGNNLVVWLNGGANWWSRANPELDNVAKGCFNVLTKLKETLEKYQELGFDQKTFGKTSRRVWKRLKWEPEDIRELRSRITSNISLLSK
jgi:hypothetical protein